MVVWAVLALALCGAAPARAEVVDDFKYCAEFFYKRTPPQGIDQNAHKICQKTYYSSYFFASLYSTDDRIPLYSAYTFNYACTSQEGRKTGNWFFEPQLSANEDDTYASMPFMKKYTAREVDSIKVKQALDDDYKHTGYDRGHLNPNSYQCNDGRDATFTLTNCAPMDACFNRVHWKEWEAAVAQTLREQDQAGTTYLVTGTVPSRRNKIPRQGVFDDPDERDYNRVNVPTHIWTAVCYAHPDEEQSFSFGYIGVNEPHGMIEVKSMEQLTGRLSTLYASFNLNIFIDNCYFPNAKSRRSEKMVKKLRRVVQMPMGDRLTMSPDVMNVLRTAMSQSDDESSSLPIKKIRLTDIKADFFYENADAWLTGIEQLKYYSGLSCLLDTPFPGSVRDELRRKRQTSPELICRLKPEVLDDCSTSCLYIEQAREYYCSTGYVTIQCSPTYSDVTVDGKKCNSDHTCGHHKWDYYWCNTGKTWGYCSPPLPLGTTIFGKRCSHKRNCAYYGTGSLWCDTDTSWQYCTR